MDLKPINYQIYETGVVDILERTEEEILPNIQKLIKDQNLLLLQIARELHRLRPDVLLTNYVATNTSNRLLINLGDYFDIQFLYNGKKVRSLHTIIHVLRGYEGIAVTINGPSVIAASDTGSYGMHPYFNDQIQVNAEIDSVRLTKISMSPTKFALTGYTQDLTSSDVNSMAVYGWGSLADFEDVMRLPNL